MHGGLWCSYLVSQKQKMWPLTRCWNASSSFTKSKSISSQSIWSCQLLVFVQTEFTATLEKSLVWEKACFASLLHCCKLWLLWEYVECIKLRTKKIINVKQDKMKASLEEKMSYVQWKWIYWDQTQYKWNVHIMWKALLKENEIYLEAKEKQNKDSAADFKDSSCLKDDNKSIRSLQVLN